MSRVDYAQLIRLEIERDPDVGELINLVANPSGELGAWGWVTPVAGSNLRGTSSGLVYTSPGGAASHFHTEPMAVTAGKYAAGSWVAASVMGSYSAIVEWLAADQETVVGSTTATSLLAGSADRQAYGSFLVPAAAFYCRLRFDHYAAGGGNPPALSWMTVRDVTVTEAATAGALGWTRTNLLPTPSAEGGLGGWGAQEGDAGTSPAQSWDGTHSFTLTKTGGPGAAALNSPSIPVMPGRDYALQGRSRSAGPVRNVTLAARWLDADGKQITTVKLKTRSEVNGVWTVPLSGVATAPTNAARLRLRMEYAGLADGEVHYVDATMVEQASRVSGYFDGETPDAFGTTFVWSGTPYASTSIATGPTGDPGTLVPVPYQNILGPSHGIDIDREGLNVGSMSVRLMDAILDPTQSDLIQPGKRIRLVTASDDGPGEVLFAGKVLTGSVAYHLLERDEQKRAEVTLVAVDPINPLAAAKRAEGVATIPELPYVLEGAGVPWSVNGDGNQVPTAEVVAYNDNASALDQVAVTRDSALGYAWVDRNGVLQAWDRDQIDTTVAAVLDESTYNADLDIAFDLDRIINSVTVKVLRVIATTGATEEVSFGPYVDADSYRTYGEHAAEYVVQGFSVDDAAAIQAYAQEILDANAQPSLRVNSATLPIKDAGDLPKALLDLYDVVTVSNARAGLNDSSRITTIQHRITAQKWLMTVGFTVEGGVAPSTAVPSPPPGVGQVKDEIDGTLGQLQLDLTELNDVTLPGVQADLNELNTVTIPSLQGKFPITSTNISDGAITTPKMTANSINGDRIAANTLHADKIVANSITGDKIQANSIAADKIVANSIGADRLAANAVTADKIAGNAIDGKTITGANIRTASSGTRVEISSGGAGRVVFYDGSQVGYVGPAAGGLLLSGPGPGYAVLDGSNFELWAGAQFKYQVVPIADAPANAYIALDGSFYKGNSSAARYKENLRPVELTSDEVLDAIDLVLFDYRQEYGGYPDKFGAIADHAVGTPLENFVVFDGGQVENFDYGRAAFVLAHIVGRAQRQQIADQTAQIADLTARIEQLEAP